MVKKQRLAVNPKWCKGCGICVAFCPQGVLGLVKQKIRILEPEKCTRCGLCELRCPDYAIWLDVDEEWGESGMAAAEGGAGK